MGYSAAHLAETWYELGAVGRAAQPVQTLLAPLRETGIIDNLAIAYRLSARHQCIWGCYE